MFPNSTVVIEEFSSNVGVQPVQVGNTYTQEISVHQPKTYTYVAEPAKTSESTVAIAPPVIPNAPFPAIPPSYNQAYVNTYRTTAARTHTIITPQVTRIEPELQVNKYKVEVPVAVPVPVERKVFVEKHVAKPYTVEVPRNLNLMLYPNLMSLTLSNMLWKPLCLTNTTQLFTNLLLMLPMLHQWLMLHLLFMLHLLLMLYLKKQLVLM